MHPDRHVEIPKSRTHFTCYEAPIYTVSGRKPCVWTNTPYPGILTYSVCWLFLSMFMAVPVVFPSGMIAAINELKAITASLGNGTVHWHHHRQPPMEGMLSILNGDLVIMTPEDMPWHDGYDWRRPQNIHLLPTVDANLYESNNCTKFLFEIGGSGVKIISYRHSHHSGSPASQQLSSTRSVTDIHCIMIAPERPEFSLAVSCLKTAHSLLDGNPTNGDAGRPSSSCSSERQTSSSGSSLPTSGSSITSSSEDLSVTSLSSSSVSDLSSSEQSGIQEGVFSPILVRYGCISGWETSTVDKNVLYEAFSPCSHSENLPPELSDTVSNRVLFFLHHLNTVDSATTRCFAATEIFVVYHQDSPVLAGCLAVVDEALDSHKISIKFPQRKDHFTADFVLLPVKRHETSPFTWLDTQLLGSHFHGERQKRAAWALGQLPSTSHIPDSTTFRFLEQQWTSEDLISGRRYVVDVVPPNLDALSSLARLKLRLYHPANASLSYELMRVLDRTLRDACADNVEEWLIAIMEVLHASARPRLDALRLFYFDYFRQFIDWQYEAFSQADYSDPLHACAYRDCPHSIPSIRVLQDLASELLNGLQDSLVSETHSGRPSLRPSFRQRHMARVLGVHVYHFQASYILLQPGERLQHDYFMRPRLNASRVTLADDVSPYPIIIWNYLPHDVQARARAYRLDVPISLADSAVYPRYNRS